MTLYNIQIPGLSISAIISILMFFYTISVKRKQQIHIVFASMLFICFIWTMSYLISFYLLSTYNIDFKLSGYINIFCANLIAVALFYMGYIYSKSDIRFIYKHIFIFIVPIITTIMLLTNNQHHLFFKSPNALYSKIVPGFYFYIHTSYSYGLILVGFAILLQFTINSSGFLSKQSFLVLIASLIPLIYNILVIVFRIIPDYIPTPISFSFSMTIFYFAIIKYDFLNVVPVALQKIMNYISDGFIVFNREYQILEYNQTFIKMFLHSIPNQNLKQNLLQMNIAGISGETMERMVEATILNGGPQTIKREVFFENKTRHYYVDFIPMFNGKKFIAEILIFRDLSQEVRHIAELKEKNAKLDKINLELQNQNTKIAELNQKLKDQAERDELTGAYNRRFFNNYFEIEKDRCINSQNHNEKKQRLDFAVAIIDIDNFKSINDTYGHLVGDQALKKVVTVIKNNVFTKDIVSRYGGEEFAIIFTKTNPKGVIQAAEKIRQAVENKKIKTDIDQIISLTISTGIAIFSVDFDENTNLLKIADDRLLIAKNLGKNRVIHKTE